jgi:hypothetical protein
MHGLPAVWQGLGAARQSWRQEAWSDSGVVAVGPEQIGEAVIRFLPNGGSPITVLEHLPCMAIKRSVVKYVLM